MRISAKVDYAVRAAVELAAAADEKPVKAVFDFLDIYVRTGTWEYHWPAFNLADSAITIGVVLLLFDGLFHRVDRAKTEHS